MKIIILPSLLAADFGRLEDGARKAEAAGADCLHLDIMDGHFVPNLSMGPAVVEMAKRCLTIPLSVHLMLTRPDRYVERFAEAGADSILIHIESDCDVPETLASIRRRGIRAGITLNPDTESKAVSRVIGAVDEVLCMTVHPGYGGQSFMHEVLPKITEIRLLAAGEGHNDLTVMVDGGIDFDTVVLCARAGANAFVAGTSLYKADNMKEEIARMRRLAADAFVI